MKKTIITGMALIISMAMQAQTVNVHFNNGQTVQFNSDQVSYVDFSEKEPEPTLTAGDAVDLGLSVYWASCNLGASKPEEKGNAYAWGETWTKDTYTQENYQYYNNNTQSYVDIGSEISGTGFDAARVNLGGEWRMPTYDDMKELYDNCTWTWSQINGVNGYRVTGSNGNSIFIPFFEDNLYQNVCGELWCGSLSKQNSQPFRLYYGSMFIYVVEVGSGSRFCGNFIRPVSNSLNGEPIDHSNDSEVTSMITANYAGGAMSIINGIVQSGSQLYWTFKNGSNKNVTLTKIQLIDGVTNEEGNNLLSENVEVKAGESVSYTITIGWKGIHDPYVRFTYRYNQNNYTVEAHMPQN